METQCLEVGCDRKVRSRGRCGTHYERWRRHNRDEVNPKPGKWFNPDGSRMLCAVDGCEIEVGTGGLCRHHYQNAHYMSNKGANKTKRHRKITNYLGVKEELFCTFPECGLPEFNPGLCAGHYTQKLRGNDLRPLYEQAECPVPGCTDKFSVAKNSYGLCRRHIALLNKYGLTKDRLVSLFLSPGCSNPGCDYVGDDRHVDHDHSCCNRRGSCGKCVRGLLCRGCNSALGQLREDTGRIAGLIEYLRR